MKATVLLVDAAAAIRDSLGHALQSKGYDVTLASTGQEALHALRTTGFDLVLLDLDMPVAKGWDTLSHIVTISLALPLIVITGRPDQQQLAAQTGVAAVLEKPLDMPLLFGVMERALLARSENGGNAMKPGSP